MPKLIGPYLDVRSFAPQNCPLDGTVDWQPYIQAAIDHILHQPIPNGNPEGLYGTLYLPAGIYRIDRPIQVIYDITFRGLQIRGDGLGYQYPLGRTRIIANFTQWPAIILHGVRGVGLYNLFIEGQNDWLRRPYQAAAGHHLYSDAWHDESLYLYYHASPLLPLPSTINGNKKYNRPRANRFSPYVGIAVDPFATDEPSTLQGSKSDLYPEPLVTPKGTQVGSVGVRIEGCLIMGFVVGISIGISGSTKECNSEDVSITDTQILATRTAVALGHGQTRNNILRNVSCTGSEYFINCVDYGNGRGNCPSIYNAKIGWTKQVFRTSHFVQNAVFEGLYVESTASIGELVGGSEGHVFNASSFILDQIPPGKPALMRLVTNGPTIFNACRFTAELEPMWFVNLGLLTFNSCNFSGGHEDRSHAFWISGLRNRVLFNQCWMDQSDNEGGFARLSSVLPLVSMTGLANTTVMPGCLFYEAQANAAPLSLRWVAGGYRGIGIGNLVVHFHADGTANFSPPDTSLLRVGDFIQSLNSYDKVDPLSPDTSVQLAIGKITDIKGGVVTLGNVPLRACPASGISVEQHPLYIVRMPMAHLPTTGDIKPGSLNKITNIKTPPGWPVWTATWRQGDRIRCTNPSNIPGANVDIIPEGAYILHIDNGDIVLSKPALGSGTGLRMFDADIRELSSTQV